MAFIKPVPVKYFDRHQLVFALRLIFENAGAWVHGSVGFMPAHFPMPFSIYSS